MKKKFNSIEEWRQEGVKRFGNDEMKWRFVCPSCGHVATVEDWKKVGASEGEVAFSCVGRHIVGSTEAFGKRGRGPCDYAGGGLIRLNPVQIEGREGNVFQFAGCDI